MLMRLQIAGSRCLSVMTLFLTMVTWHAKTSAFDNPDTDDRTSSERSKPEELRRELFLQLDRNSDGVLVGEELRSSSDANRVRIRLIDRDADGQITLEEFQAYDAMEGSSRR